MALRIVRYVNNYERALVALQGLKKDKRVQQVRLCVYVCMCMSFRALHCFIG